MSIGRGRGGVEPRQRDVGDLDDVARQHRDDPRGERRRDGAALVAPFVALAEEQAFAGDRPQDADGGAGAPIILDVVHQHMVDCVGRIEQEALAPEKGLLQHVLGIGVPRPDLQRVGAQRAQKAVPAHALFRNVRARRNEMPGGVDVHGVSPGEDFIARPMAI